MQENLQWHFIFLNFIFDSELYVQQKSLYQDFIAWQH